MQLTYPLKVTVSAGSVCVVITVLTKDTVTGSGTEISVSVVNSVKVLYDRQQLISVPQIEKTALRVSHNEKQHCKARRVQDPVSGE